MANVERPKESDLGSLNLALALAYVRDKQIPLMKRLGDYNTDKDTLARYGNALAIEVSEFVNCTPWKRWQDKPIEPTRLKDEFADILHFLGLWIAIMDLWGITATELALAYLEKNDRNHLRFSGEEPGYGTPETGYAPIAKEDSFPIPKGDPNELIWAGTGVTHPITGREEGGLVARYIAEENGWTDEHTKPNPKLVAKVQGVLDAVQRVPMLDLDEDDDDDDETDVEWANTPMDSSEGEDL